MFKKRPSYYCNDVLFIWIKQKKLHLIRTAALRWFGGVKLIQSGFYEILSRDERDALSLS